MATTPEEWLPILTKRLDADRPRLRLLRRYVDGDAPLPEMGANVRASWQKFQKESRTNWGFLIRESVADRIVPNGIQVNGDLDHPVAKQAQRIWRDNRMDLVFKDAVRHMLDFRIGYLTAWERDGQAVITADSPETMYAATNPLQPWRVRAALRWWRDDDDEKDYAVVWVDGGWQLFSRPVYVTPNSSKMHYRAASDTWTPEQEMTVTNAPPPVVVMENPDKVGEFETHLDLINRINRGILQRLTTAAMQAYRQRALRAKEGSPGLPDKDEQGNDIDWAKVFEPAPGALWDLPPGIDIWESQQTDIRPMLEGSMSDIRQLAAVTRTPVSVLIPDSANQAAAGAEFAKEGLVFKTKDRLEVAKIAAAAVLLKGLEIEEVSVDDTLEVLFEPPHAVSMSEKYDAATKAKSAGESWKSIARNILGYSPEQIAQDALDRAEEQLATAALLGPAPDGAGPGEDSKDMKARFDALGVAVRAGVDPIAAAEQLGLDGLVFTGAIPVALRPPESQARELEEK
ncbi:phage portal protein [Nocardia sp. CC227C]|uniref:phage portal protein n=1 Tax=Nocardia sp. CC227C TaxID=3044562 RepID=UPI00278BBE61|nr:phage portal protein [Nocardia sp. CC227C]